MYVKYCDFCKNKEDCGERYVRIVSNKTPEVVEIQHLGESLIFGRVKNYDICNNCHNKILDFTKTLRK